MERHFNPEHPLDIMWTTYERWLVNDGDDFFYVAACRELLQLDATYRVQQNRDLRKQVEHLTSRLGRETVGDPQLLPGRSTCPYCHGWGWWALENHETETCTYCGGLGFIEVTK